MLNKRLPQILQLFRQWSFIQAGFFWHSPILAQPGHWSLYWLSSSQLAGGGVVALIAEMEVNKYINTNEIKQIQRFVKKQNKSKR